MYKKQVAPALVWLKTFAENNATDLTRTIHAADRDLDGPTIVTDASPWGGGALLWSTRRAYEQKEPAEQFLCVTWTKVHEQVIGGKIGIPDFQADWEAFMAAVAVRTWISSRSRGRITLVVTHPA